MHAYCINLERSPERRLQAQSEFEREGLDVEFFQATDGKVEAPDGLFITKSEWGCADSHIRVWKDIIHNGYETALVFEDDIQLVPDFKDKLEQILSELPPDWDYVNIGTTDQLNINFKRFSENLMIGQALNTHAYIIHNRCARKWSDFQAKYFKSQFDVFIANYPSKNFHVEKGIAVQGSGQSVIGGGLNRTYDWTFFVNKWGFWFVIAVVLILLYIFRKPVLG
jgi:GR25 family glycosyltransferase involved in LPS biosynthesis